MEHLRDLGLRNREGGHIMTAQHAVGVRTLIVGLVSTVLLGSIGVAGERPARTEAVRIGLIGTLFRDMPQSTVMAVMQPFGALMESQTGVSGELVPAGDSDNLGQQIADDKIQLGVFHGIEYAWAKAKHPELRPLVIAINKMQHLQSFVVVRDDSNLRRTADLRGKVLALPRGSREHCYLFLEKLCKDAKQGIQGYFSKITNPTSVEDAMDDVVDGNVQAAVVDNVSIDCFKRRKPGRFAKLRVLASSETFPPAVVAYRPGSLDDATLQRFRDGLMNSSNTVLGKQLLTLWKLTGFEPVPSDFDQLVTDIAKAYPPPSK
jgi:ABC-type phosphate/phosphonate transport system substrate-binding protein